MSRSRKLRSCSERLGGAVYACLASIDGCARGDVECLPTSSTVIVFMSMPNACAALSLRAASGLPRLADVSRRPMLVAVSIAIDIGVFDEVAQVESSSRRSGFPSNGSLAIFSTLRFCLPHFIFFANSSGVASRPIPAASGAKIRFTC